MIPEHCNDKAHKLYLRAFCKSSHLDLGETDLIKEKIGMALAITDFIVGIVLIFALKYLSYI